MKKLLGFATLLTALSLSASAQQVVPPGDTALVCAYNAIPPSITSGNFGYVQCDSQGQMIVSGNLTNATSNLTFSVTTTGKDTNPCTNALPCLTVQRAVNVANSYNWNNLYFPTINIANGTYAGTQVVLPSLIDCPAGGQIIGNTSTPTNVLLNDAGTTASLTISSGSVWTVNGVSFSGTFGGFDVKSFGVLNFNQINWGGALSNIGFNVEPLAAVYAGNAVTVGGTFSITAATMQEFIFSRGLLVLDNSTLTITNPLALNNFIALDSSASFFAFDNSNIVNPNNVSVATWALIMNNGAFFEGDSTAHVGGAAMTRYNFPGGSSGAKVLIDGQSTFQPDAINSTSAILGGYAPGTTVLNGMIVLSDGAGNVRADYGINDAGNWTVSAINGGFGITSANVADTGFKLTNTSVGGHASAFFTAGSSGILGLTAGQGGYFDVTNGNAVFWYDLSGNMTLSAGLGFSAQTPFTANAPDAGLSRVGAASLAIGNGTAGDTSGQIRAAGHIAGGVVPTGTAGSCSASSFVGGKTAGKFTAPLCAAGTIILSALPTAPNGWTCNAQDQTTPADLLKQTATTVSAVTFSNVTTALNDIVVFQCMGW